jgi:5-(carboxyamino)imidazole ribonucleotide mutase
MPLDYEFGKVLKLNKGCAVVMAGSGSDKPHIDKIAESLRKYNVPFEVRICSAHKQLTDLVEMILDYNNAGCSVAYVAVAGGTDALSGVLSFNAFGPVISCPPDAPNQSCLTNPPGSSNAYIVRPENVGRFIAQIYAGVNPAFREILEKERQDKIQLLREADKKLREAYRG